MQLSVDEIVALQTAPFEDILDLWEEIEIRHGHDIRRELALVDRFFLLVVLLHRKDALHPWLYERCREVELDPDGYLDLWAREHYKSTIITFAGIVQEILRDPEITIVIFSHTKPIARKFMLQIKQEFETNEELVRTFPDILWADPRKEAPKWSEEKGLTVRRRSNPKEATLESHGLVDGQPTGGHWTLRVYDDVVTLESVSTPEQVQKATTAWELSDNLGARSPGVDIARAWHVGTRYSFADSYNDIMERGALKPRVYAATANGLPDGVPVMLTPAAWAAKKVAQGPATIACQMLQNPAAGNEAMFKKEWLQFIDIRPSTLNVYIICDPASSKKKGSDNTAMAVIGIDSGGNKFLLDGYRHKMNLKERWENFRNLRRVWMSRPGVQMVKMGYEKYGMQSDLEYFEEQMKADKDAFEIMEINWTKDGTESKTDRVQRLVPDFVSQKFFLARLCVRRVPLLDENNQPVLTSDGEPVMVNEPYETAAQIKLRERGQGFRVFSPVKRRDHEGNMYSLNKGFLDEYLFFPFSSKKDLIDCVSRIYDMEPVSPVIIDQSTLEPTQYSDGV